MPRSHIVWGVLMALLLTASGVAVNTVRAQNAREAGTLIADGFNGPQGILVPEDGSIWVIDAGLGGEEAVPAVDPNTGQVVTATLGNTARVVRITPHGEQEVVATMPSIFVGSDITGGARLAILNGEMYASNGVWYGAATEEALPDTAAILRVLQGEVLEWAPVWKVERDENPDGFIQESHPYGLAAGPDGFLYVADAGANALLRVDPETRAVEVLAVFDGVPSPLPNPNRGDARESDPVPTGVAFGADGKLYVSLLPGFPFLPGSAKVVVVDPNTGAVSDYATGLTMLTDLRTGPDGRLYAVQLGVFTDQGPRPDSGAVVRVAPGPGSRVVIDGLSFPTSVDFDDAGNAYVTVNGVGAPGSGAVLRFDGIAVAGAEEATTGEGPQETATPEGPTDLNVSCDDLPGHAELTEVLAAVVEAGDSGGFGNNVWAALVDRDGVVCAVTFSGRNRGDQWPGGRVIAAQKANTANAFSLPGLALSTANLYAAVQPGGSLYGLENSNPVDTFVAYAGPATAYGTANDPMVGRRIGGVNVFGGGLPLYDANGAILGGIGVSGDTSCTDHIVVWKVRDALRLDFVPTGVSDTEDDNIIFDMQEDARGHLSSLSGFGHPSCGLGEEEIAADLPVSFPPGPNGTGASE